MLLLLLLLLLLALMMVWLLVLCRHDWLRRQDQSCRHKRHAWHKACRHNR